MKIEIIGSLTVGGHYINKILPDGTVTEYQYHVVSLTVGLDGQIYQYDEKYDKWTSTAFDCLAEDSPTGKMTIEVEEEKEHSEPLISR
jgi:hypothetical protein